jgi:hypothetical protein
MRRMTAPLAQRVLFLSESQQLAAARIGQKLGLPIARVLRILRDRQTCSIRVPQSTGVKVHSVHDCIPRIPHGGGLGHFPKTESRKKRSQNRRTR